MSDDDEYDIPLQDQRVFGTGLKRKRVHFVPSSTSLSTTADAPTTSNSTSVADRYLSLVLSKSGDVGIASTSSVPMIQQSTSLQTDISSSDSLCDICSLPLVPSSASAPTPPQLHEASLAHQVCLKHSHPPSHLDRSRLGLRYLQSQGWDPDSRKGLGAQGQGIQFPVKAKPKDDKLGLGLVFPDTKEVGKGALAKKEVKEKLDAGKVRKLEERDRRKRERLHEMFYRSEDLDRYLGSG